MAGMHLADALVILLSGDRYLSGGETDCPEVLHDGTCMTRMCLLPVGVMLQGPQKRKLWTSKNASGRDYLENGEP